MHHTNDIHAVPVLIGATQSLVGARKKVVKYETNRQIKTWSFYFLLKSLTTSGQLQQWICQRQHLLAFTQCNEGTFRSRLNELKKLNLATVDAGYNINLTSYRKAATILGIEYKGTTLIAHKPGNGVSQSFQYSLMADEIRANQDDQLKAIRRKLSQNPLLAHSIDMLLCENGAVYQNLNNLQYFQEQLLRLQKKAFREGSEDFALAFELRADLNRSQKKLQEVYNYISPRSINYIKSVLKKAGLITIKKVKVESNVRSRIFVPGDDGRPKQGYLWLKQQAATLWQLCDQIIVSPLKPIRHAQSSFAA